ncbi:DUF397 domain-containing protein [Lentzea sp. BCCO 10_0798]|uniref:DUF397 domain-containing protein n=1 Tax=Lentzea kristufekii TaxID=3095430 RepID=A0ABU4TKM6_9PSEU|nr:DUF397 domain-containing protein [Lentzea sp. BCCO 10_0798]MDX8048836.1 DUF397 domain-containing protein [Lentzea sp. BCCO 10_0798]
MTSERTWRKSSYSGNTTDSACVEVALSDAALVRDSKNASGDVLAFSAPAWRSMLSWLD